MKQKVKPFVPMKIYFDRIEYKKAQKDCEAKLNVINNALEWSKQFINIESIDKKKFLIDMVEEFNRILADENKDKFNIELKIDKLHYLLDVNILELQKIQEEYEHFQAKVYVDDGVFISGVSEEDFTRYTKDQEENDRVIKANNLINALDLVAKYVKIYPADIVRGTSNFLQYDLRENKYMANL